MNLGVSVAPALRNAQVFEIILSNIPRHHSPNEKQNKIKYYKVEKNQSM
jgi:hypothetical protein